MTAATPRMRTALLLGLLALLALPAVAAAHGASGTDYKTTITSIEPDGIPIDVRAVNGDQLRIENQGDEELIVCGYLPECEPYLRIGPDGVFENRNSKAYFANLDSVSYGEVPKDAGEGPPEWKRVRRAPPFFAYHDHRTHWMGGKQLPPGVDASNPDPQKVNDFQIDMRYGDTPVVVKGRLEYVGGRTWLQKYGEYLLVIGGILAMLVVFVVDARRRRRARAAGVAGAAAADGTDADAEREAEVGTHG